MAFGDIARGLGGVGNDLGSGAAYLQKVRQQELERQLQQWQLQMELANYQDRVKQQQRATPAGQLAGTEEALKRKLTPEEQQRLFHIQPPASEAPEKTIEGKVAAMEKVLERKLTDKEKKQLFKIAPTGPKTGTIDPIIARQIGMPPDPEKFPQGEDDPMYKVKSKQWGIEAEKVKTRMAVAVAEARGGGFNMSRTAGYLTPEGQLVTATARQALAGGYVPYQPGMQTMSKQAQFSEMQSASGKLRSALQALKEGDAFTPTSTMQLTLATRTPDLGTMQNAITNAAAGSLNEQQQDAVIWIGQMMERIMSIRNIAGMGQGAEDLRRAVQATIPSLVAGNKEFALKRLDAVDQQINMLYRGVPKAGKLTDQVMAPTTLPSNVPPPPPGATLDQ